jgi:hypothetical protein
VPAERVGALPLFCCVLLICARCGSSCIVPGLEHTLAQSGCSFWGRCLQRYVANLLSGKCSTAVKYPFYDDGVLGQAMCTAHSMRLIRRHDRRRSHDSVACGVLQCPPLYELAGAQCGHAGGYRPHSRPQLPDGRSGTKHAPSVRPLKCY